VLVSHGTALDAQQYSEARVQLEPEDRVLLYSDGVIEAENPAGDEYGAARRVDFLARPEASAKPLLADVQAFIRGSTLSDDATAVVLRRC
jgi:serine phosphatase RsbU (regulator of sigma subunit)